jgi:hypothetical protein
MTVSYPSSIYEKLDRKGREVQPPARLFSTGSPRLLEV